MSTVHRNQKHMASRGHGDSAGSRITRSTGAPGASRISKLQIDSIHSDDCLLKSTLFLPLGKWKAEVSLWDALQILRVISIKNKTGSFETASYEYQQPVRVIELLSVQSKAVECQAKTYGENCCLSQKKPQTPSTVQNHGKSNIPPGYKKSLSSNLQFIKKKVAAEKPPPLGISQRCKKDMSLYSPSAKTSFVHKKSSNPKKNKAESRKPDSYQEFTELPNASVIQAGTLRPHIYAPHVYCSTPKSLRSGRRQPLRVIGRVVEPRYPAGGQGQKHFKRRNLQLPDSPIYLSSPESSSFILMKLEEDISHASPISPIASSGGYSNQREVLTPNSREEKRRNQPSFGCGGAISTSFADRLLEELDSGSEVTFTINM